MTETFIDIILTLSDVQEYLETIPSINRGGCGISALAIFRWLKLNNENDDTKFVFLYNQKSDYLNNKKVLKGQDGNPSVPGHCCLLYDGKFIDSAGKYDISNYSWLQIIDEEEFITKSLNEQDSWNHSFDREYIKQIEAKLKIDLSDVEE